MKNIFVGNLSFSSSEDAVRGLFEAYGTVDRVSIITDRETGRSRGFAFVEMGNDEEAERAINALNGADFGARKLNVNEARPREERPFGGRCRTRRRPWRIRRRGARRRQPAARAALVIATFLEMQNGPPADGWPVLVLGRSVS